MFWDLVFWVNLPLVGLLAVVVWAASCLGVLGLFGMVVFGVWIDFC